MLRAVGATPKQVKIAMSASISDVQAKVSAAQKMLNGLKQYKRPDIAATINALQNRLSEAQRRLNALKQQKKPDVNAINKASAVVDRIKNDIASVHDKTVTVTTKWENIGKGKAGAIIARRPSGCHCSCWASQGKPCAQRAKFSTGLWGGQPVCGTNRKAEGLRGTRKGRKGFRSPG